MLIDAHWSMRTEALLHKSMNASFFYRSELVSSMKGAIFSSPLFLESKIKWCVGDIDTTTLIWETIPGEIALPWIMFKYYGSQDVWSLIRLFDQNRPTSRVIQSQNGTFKALRLLAWTSEKKRLILFFSVCQRLNQYFFLTKRWTLFKCHRG